jgi:hypothetical protein
MLEQHNSHLDSDVDEGRPESSVAIFSTPIRRKFSNGEGLLKIYAFI